MTFTELRATIYMSADDRPRGRKVSERRFLLNEKKKSDRVLAAAVEVASKRGAKWCLENPVLFQELVWDRVSIFVKIVLGILSIFGGPSVLLLILGILIPLFLRWLESRENLVTGSSPDVLLVELAGEAKEYLK